MTDTSSTAQVKARKRAIRRLLERRLKVMASVLSTRDGRELVWHLLESDFVFKAVTPGDWSDFNNGQRNSGLRLFSLCNEADPEWLSKAMKEHLDATKAGDPGETEAEPSPEQGGIDG